LDEVIAAVRAERKLNVPVVLSREEVSKVVAVMEGVPQLIVKLLYGSGLRILEAVRLRVKDVDFTMKQVTVPPLWPLRRLSRKPPLTAEGRQRPSAPNPR
jgi:integrase